MYSIRARVNFTLQPQLLLVPILYEDDWDTIIKKMNLTARFIDLYIISRFTNYKTLNYSTIKNFVFNITKDIRGCSIPELKEKLNAHYLNFESKPEDEITKTEYDLIKVTKVPIKKNRNLKYGTETFDYLESQKGGGWTPSSKKWNRKRDIYRQYDSDYY